MSDILKMVYKNLSKVGIPVAYGFFANNEPVKLPYIVYSCSEKVVSCDSDIYISDYNFNVELYYNAKDVKIEEKFRMALYDVKKVIDFEQSLLDNNFLLRATFNLLEKKEI